MLAFPVDGEEAFSSRAQGGGDNERVVLGEVGVEGNRSAQRSGRGWGGEKGGGDAFSLLQSGFQHQAQNETRNTRNCRGLPVGAERGGGVRRRGVAGTPLRPAKHVFFYY